jgi:hypothetical protein
MGFAPEWFIWASRVSLALDGSRAPNRRSGAGAEHLLRYASCSAPVPALVHIQLTGDAAAVAAGGDQAKAAEIDRNR